MPLAQIREAHTLAEKRVPRARSNSAVFRFGQRFTTACRALPTGTTDPGHGARIVASGTAGRFG
jgi:hypothetical protein